MENYCATDVVAVIIAGGQNRRMDGREKCLLDLCGSTILNKIITTLSGQVGEIVINSNLQSTILKEYTLPILPDTIGFQMGPLAGVASSMEWLTRNRTNCSWVLTVPADTPFLPSDLMSRLHTVAFASTSINTTTSSADIVMASNNGRQHYLTALWSMAIYPQLEQFLNGGGRAVNAFLATQKIACADFTGDADIDPFFNINTPDDLIYAEQYLNQTVKKPKQ